jgi:hypothetical protein
MDDKIVAYKGFDKDLKCRGFQYEVGESYKTEKAKCCESGFHSCEYPLNVFDYYQPCGSRFAEVEASGDIDRRDEDTKISSTKITIKAELKIPALVEAAVKFVFDRVDWKNKKETNTGDQSAATNTGDRSAATVEGKESIAFASGIEGRAKGSVGCWLVLAEWKEKKDGWHIKDVKTTIVDGKKVKADTFYILKRGKFVEAKS